MRRRVSHRHLRRCVRGNPVLRSDRVRLAQSTWHGLPPFVTHCPTALGQASNDRVTPRPSSRGSTHRPFLSRPRRVNRHALQRAHPTKESSPEDAHWLVLLIHMLPVLREMLVRVPPLEPLEFVQETPTSMYQMFKAMFHVPIDTYQPHLSGVPCFGSLRG
jgi:hypothetical protein